MSQVNILGCPICNPEVADFRGIRRTVVPTSTELLWFVKHVISAHTGEPIVKIPIPKGDNNLEVRALREQATDAPAKIDAPKSE